MKFTLSMNKAWVAGRDFDKLTLVWSQNVSQKQVLEISERWISDKTLLIKHMAGLQKVGSLH